MLRQKNLTILQAKLKIFDMNDSTHTIFQSARHFFSGTALSRISGMLRDMSMAYVFGTEPSIASFMLAFRFSHLLRRLFGEGALQAAFIPEFESLRHQESSQAFSFFRNLYLVLTLFLSGLITIGCVSLGIALNSAYFSRENNEIILLTLLMLPSLLFICLYGLNASLLQCEKRYFTASAAPAAFNGIWILTVLALRHLNSQAAMHWLACGVVIACFCQWAITLPGVYSILKMQLNHNLWKEVKCQCPTLIKFSRPLLLGIVGVAASQINNTVDAVFARFAEPEGPALLWYAIRIQQLPLALFGIAISGAILPPLTRAIKAADQAKYLHFLEYACKQTITLIIPMTCCLLIMGDTWINFIYGRGDFNQFSIAATTRCLWAYALGLFPSALILIFAPACYAQGNYRLPAIASFIAMGMNGILNAWMIIGLGLGSVSVAIATSMSSWANFIFLAQALIQKKSFYFSSHLIAHFTRISLSSLIAFITLFCVRTYWGDQDVILLIKGLTPNFPKEFISQMLLMIWQFAVFACIFLISKKIFSLSFLELRKKEPHKL